MWLLVASLLLLAVFIIISETCIAKQDKEWQEELKKTNKRK